MHDTTDTRTLRAAPRAGLALAVGIGAVLALGIPAVASASLIAPTVTPTLDALPTTPACSADTSGDVDEEICMYVTNALVAWHPGTATPQLSGSGTKLFFTASSDIGGGWAEGYGAYWAGPFCAAATWTNWNVDGGNSSDQAGPDNGRDKCIGETQAFTFGQRRQVQFWDDDSSASSGEWKLYGKVGSTKFQGVFRAANNDGDTWHGDPSCDFNNNGLSQWTSCGAIGATGYHGVLNTAPANDGITADRISAGFYVQNFPVAIMVKNDLPGSTFTVQDEQAITHARKASTASTFKAGAVARPNHPLWWVGYRQRLGHRNGATSVNTITIPLSGKLEPEVNTGIAEQWHGAVVHVTLKLTAEVGTDGVATGGVVVDRSPTACTMTETTKSGAQAKCEVSEPDAGGPSSPAHLVVRIHD